MPRLIIATMMLITSGAATAQTAVGNPPGNTLAPATGAVVAATPPMPTVTIVPAKTPAQLAADKYKTELVCKTSVETGSLIARRKMCLTRKQWAYVDDENSRFAHKLVEDNAGKSPGF